MSKTKIERLTATEALIELASGRLTSEALVAACLARIGDRDEAVGAWTHLDSDRALNAARAIDARRARGEPLPSLAGIPIGIKDIIDTEDFPTEYGSPVFAGRQPSADAFIVAQLRAAGAIILGKTVTTELAFFGPGKTRNPHDLERTPGGSSSGSAAAVADDQVPLALGTQTAGSVIRPASYCGAIGFKPTFGYVSRAGVLEQSAPLDTIGGYARSIEDIALLFDAIGGYDAADRDMTPDAKPSLVAALREPAPRVPRFAFVRSLAWPLADAAMKSAFESFAGSFGAHAEVVETELPSDFEGGLRLPQIVQFSDIAKNYGPIADANPDRVSAKLTETIAEGRSFSAADYAAARADQEQLYEALKPILANHDAILTPAATGPALVGLGGTGSPMFNALWTYLGMPCISLPLLDVEGLPVGVQLVGARGSDTSLLRVANWLMQELPRTT
ncbi:MAG TPA: amidase [Hyphomicrobium sp.]|jgi:Asp-tRNA(Asn)/Glu-tRNA(Gln) amidotransferase A subunit family amidase